MKVSKQDIGSFVCFVLAVINLKVVMKKFLSLIDLSGAQTLCLCEFSKIVMINKYEDFILKAF